MNNLQNKPKDALFSIKRKPVVALYDNIMRTKNYLGLTSRSGGDASDLSTFYNGSYLDPYFKKIGNNNLNCIKLSDTLYSTNRVYQNILNYLSNIYYYRYVVVPRQIKKVDVNANINQFNRTKQYGEIYQEMIEIVEGLKIETTFPKLLLEIFKNGQIYLYTVGDKKSKTLSTIILPNEKCRSTIMTQYGTRQIEFNFKFFDELTKNDEQREKLFDVFPSEFKILYNECYKQGLYPTGWIPLNPKSSTCISMNEKGFPTFLSVFYDIIDYKNYKMNEMDRSTNGLERLVVQEIDTEKTGLDMTEVQLLHESMGEQISQNGSILITTPGKIKVEQIQEERSQENKVLQNAYKTIYDNAGFNNEIFSGDSDASLTASVNRDLTFVWTYVEELVNFYNLAINNVFNFQNYQASIRILPISPYNEKEKMELYNKNATLGIGVLDNIVASGIKQVDLQPTLELEQFLDLRNRLIPLKSSHTQSSSTTSEKTKPAEDRDKNNPDENSESSVEDRQNEE